MPARPVTIRLARPDDTATVRRLAHLDSARTLRGGVLLAESDGVAVAAISLYTGAVVADPFQRAEEAIRLLRRRRHQLLPQQERNVARRPPLLRRLEPGRGEAT
jgi:hypothetical protein